MIVHILGLSTDMDELIKICKKNKLILFEDTCESLGTKYRSKNLGNFGDFDLTHFIILIKSPQEKEEWLFAKIKMIIKY